MIFMVVMIPPGDEALDGLTKQVLSIPAEELLYMRVEQNDGSIIVNDYHCVGRSFEEPEKTFIIWFKFDLYFGLLVFLQAPFPINLCFDAP